MTTRTDIGVACLRATDPRGSQRRPAVPDAEGATGAGCRGARRPGSQTPRTVTCSGGTCREPREGPCTLLRCPARCPAPHRCSRGHRTSLSLSAMQQEAFMRRLLSAGDGAEAWGVSQPRNRPQPVPMSRWNVTCHFSGTTRCWESGEGCDGGTWERPEVWGPCWGCAGLGGGPPSVHPTPITTFGAVTGHPGPHERPAGPFMTPGWPGQGQQHQGALQGAWRAPRSVAPMQLPL